MVVRVETEKQDAARDRRSAATRTISPVNSVLSPIEYTAYIDTPMRLHVRCLVLIRADLRSADADRSAKAIGHYDTPCN